MNKHAFEQGVDAFIKEAVSREEMLDALVYSTLNKRGYTAATVGGTLGALPSILSFPKTQRLGAAATMLGIGIPAGLLLTKALDPAMHKLRRAFLQNKSTEEIRKLYDDIKKDPWYNTLQLHEKSR
jgi:hypothetical protein